MCSCIFLMKRLEGLIRVLIRSLILFVCLFARFFNGIIDEFHSVSNMTILCPIGKMYVPSLGN